MATEIALMERAVLKVIQSDNTEMLCMEICEKYCIIDTFAIHVFMYRTKSETTLYNNRHTCRKNDAFCTQS